MNPASHDLFENQLQNAIHFGMSKKLFYSVNKMNLKIRDDKKLEQ